MLGFPKPWVGLNGACFVAPNLLLAAGAAALVWRVDLAEDGTASARVWLQHDSMKKWPLWNRIIAEAAFRNCTDVGEPINQG